MGLGAGAHSSLRAARKPPACWPPIRVGAETDTVTNVPQPAWSQGRRRQTLPHGGVCVCVCVRASVCAWGAVQETLAGLRSHS